MGHRQVDRPTQEQGNLNGRYRRFVRYLREMFGLFIFALSVMGASSYTYEGPCPEACIEIYEPVCGSNGETYSNVCYLQMAACNSATPISQASEGECPCPEHCTKDYNPVCGSNGETYSNKCGLLIAACNSATPISQAYEGECVHEGEDCPTEQPEFGSACSLPQFAKCPYGEECCCGECHPSLMMMCAGGSVEASSNATGSWTGYNTDVCMRPDCGTTTDTPNVEEIYEGNCMDTGCGREYGNTGMCVDFSVDVDFSRLAASFNLSAGSKKDGLCEHSNLKTDCCHCMQVSPEFATTLSTTTTITTTTSTKTPTTTTNTTTISTSTTATTTATTSTTTKTTTTTSVSTSTSTSTTTTATATTKTTTTKPTTKTTTSTSSTTTKKITTKTTTTTSTSSTTTTTKT